MVTYKKTVYRSTRPLPELSDICSVKTVRYESGIIYYYTLNNNNDEFPEIDPVGKDVKFPIPHKGF